MAVAARDLDAFTELQREAPAIHYMQALQNILGLQAGSFFSIDDGLKGLFITCSRNVTVAANSNEFVFAANPEAKYESHPDKTEYTGDIAHFNAEVAAHMAVDVLIKGGTPTSLGGSAEQQALLLAALEVHGVNIQNVQLTAQVSQQQFDAAKAEIRALNIRPQNPNPEDTALAHLERAQSHLPPMFSALQQSRQQITDAQAIDALQDISDVETALAAAETHLNSIDQKMADPDIGGVVRHHMDAIEALDQQGVNIPTQAGQSRFVYAMLNSQPATMRTNIGDIRSAVQDVQQINSEINGFGSTHLTNIEDGLAIVEREARLLDANLANGRFDHVPADVVRQRDTLDRGLQRNYRQAADAMNDLLSRHRTIARTNVLHPDLIADLEQEIEDQVRDSYIHLVHKRDRLRTTLDGLNNRAAQMKAHAELDKKVDTAQSKIDVHITEMESALLDYNDRLDQNEPYLSCNELTADTHDRIRTGLLNMFNKLARREPAFLRVERELQAVQNNPDFAHLMNATAPANPLRDSCERLADVLGQIRNLPNEIQSQATRLSNIPVDMGVATAAPGFQQQQQQQQQQQSSGGSSNSGRRQATLGPPAPTNP